MFLRQPVGQCGRIQFGFVFGCRRSFMFQSSDRRTIFLAWRLRGIEPS
jgi:hypothetical protein